MGLQYAGTGEVACNAINPVKHCQVKLMACGCFWGKQPR